MLKRGLLKGELLKGGPSEIMSRYVEHTETDGRPLVKAYTRKEALQLFADFRECRVHVNQLTRTELGFVSRLLPEDAFQSLARSFGWNLIIKAVK